MIKPDQPDLYDTYVDRDDDGTYHGPGCTVYWIALPVLLIIVIGFVWSLIHTF